MSKRLQVLFDPKEYKALSQAAKTSGLSIGEWVRKAIRASLKFQSVRPGDEKLRVLKALSKHNYPSGDIEVLLEEIGKGQNS